MPEQPFAPAYTNGAVLTVGAPAVYQIPKTGSVQLCLTGMGAGHCFVRVSNSAATIASDKDYLVPPNFQQVAITVDPEHLFMSHFAPVATTLHVIPGKGP